MNNIYKKFITLSGKQYSDAKILDIKNIKILLVDNDQIIIDKEYLVTHISYDTKNFYFYESTECGFMVYRPETISTLICELHRKIIKEIGVIKEVFCIKENPTFENFGFIFNCEADSDIMNSITVDYKQKCRRVNLPIVINTMELFPVAYEANGNIILYDKNKTIYLYAFDTSRANISLLDNVPHLTFYKFDEIDNFKQYAQKFFAYY
jgi:hypothetical protein